MLTLKATLTCDGPPAFRYYDSTEDCPDKAQTEVEIQIVHDPSPYGGEPRLGITLPPGWGQYGHHHGDGTGAKARYYCKKCRESKIVKED